MERGIKNNKVARISISKFHSSHPTDCCSRGVTLVVLVVTVIVLLLLTGITITALVGNDGIIEKTGEISNKIEEESEQDYQEINGLVGELNTSIVENDENILKVSANLGRVISETENVVLKDSYNNKITIPAGFHIVTPSEDNTVEYNYSGNGIPTVQDGIVIEDSDGNQFVWIPVGTINNKEGDLNGKTTTIELARYSFDITIDSSTEAVTGGTGAIKNKVTDGGSLVDERVEISSVGYEYLEQLSTSTTYDNTKAKDIEEFKESSRLKKGYYLARYEASYRDETRPYSKPSTGTPRTSASTSLTEGMIWNFITQEDASTVCRNMYTNINYESDLVNSYAWDTAIVFIQTYSGDSDYSKQASINKSFSNTGVNGDKVCNINDMASNCTEWTTETSTYSRINCIYRGGCYYYPNFYTSLRHMRQQSMEMLAVCFRPILYINLL